MKQVDKDHYSFGTYAHTDRFASYFYQLKEIHATTPKNVLEIGVGDAVIGNYLRDNTDIDYTSLDIAADVNPTVIGSVLSLPFEDNTFDVVCAFEVLEHIPFDSFEKAISEMTRVARNRVLVSVPHFGPPIMFSFKIPFLKHIRFAYKLPYHPKHTWNGQHYWELGKKGYSVGEVKKILLKYGTLINHYVPFENQYHHFFILEKKSL